MDVSLIEAVQTCPALYDKCNENYSNRTFLNHKWKEIGEELGIEGQAARKKWTCLRDYFQKQFRRMSTFKPSRSQSTLKKWYLHDHMSFLLPHIKIKDVEDIGELFPPFSDDEADDDSQPRAMTPTELSAVSLKEETPTPSDDANTIDIEIPETDPSPLQGIKSKRKRDHYPTERREAFQFHPQFDIQMIATNFAQTMQDEDELFCRSLIPKMRRLEDISKAECQLEMQTVILRYLKRSSAVTSATNP